MIRTRRTRGMIREEPENTGEITREHDHCELNIKQIMGIAGCLEEDWSDQGRLNKHSHYVKTVF